MAAAGASSRKGQGLPGWEIPAQAPGRRAAALPRMRHLLQTRRCAPGRAPRLREQDGRLLLGVVLARHLLQLVKEVAAAQPLLRARARARACWVAA